MRPATAVTSLLLAAVASGAAACADSPQEPSAAPLLHLPAIPAAASRDLELGACDEIGVPEGSKLVLRAYAEGVQIYRWDNGTWGPQGPSATLYADADRRGTIGIHYGGPTWESNDGSYVVGRLKTPCEVGPSAIPWLLLDGIRTRGPGIFQRVTHIQRVNTAGGRAPTAPGSPGEVRNVPYTAEYYFYRAP
jgi:Protein of unknown function (DUF3455)